jgi:hypothetical protein
MDSVSFSLVRSSVSTEEIEFSDKMQVRTSASLASVAALRLACLRRAHAV